MQKPFFNLITEYFPSSQTQWIGRDVNGIQWVNRGEHSWRISHTSYYHFYVCAHKLTGKKKHINQISLMTDIFPNSPYIEVLTRKSLETGCNWVPWKASIVLWELWDKRPGMSPLFLMYMVWRANHSILPYHILIPVKWESPRHSDEHRVSQTNFCYFWQCRIGVRSIKSKSRVLAPNPWLCHLLETNQEHL